MSEHAPDLTRPIGDRRETTTCYMCACRCGITAHLRDGRVVYLEGTRAHPVNRGVICAKGSAGIQQHYSPARLSAPLLRTGERGRGEFREIGWDEALTLLTARLARIRATDPDRLAFFTGRDQSQALTGWWAQQFGTVNYAAHGGFCSVNMAAAGMYTLGGSFWEFGEPDWAHTRLLLLWGVAEDHDSNPIKLGLAELKARGVKIVAINPVRTGYAAIADQWLAIRPGSDGLLAGALVHELLRTDRIDLDYLVRYANAHWLVIDAPGGSDDGLVARAGDGAPLCWDRATGGPRPASATGTMPAVVGEFVLPDGRRTRPVFELLARRFLAPAWTPDAVAARTGIAAAAIRALAAELAAAAFDQPLELAQPWTDVHGREHATMPGRPVAMHAMRGIAAHSNGFHTARLLHVLQLLLGAVDTPGSFRYQPPYPKGIPPHNRPGRERRADGSLDAPPLGYPRSPADLVVDAAGRPRRIDKAFSWAYPLAVHGLLHTVIRNACAGDPYPIDTLLLFMANMSWNSAMATGETMRMLCERDASGEYRIPFVVYSDAYRSEMVAYADLVLPDTTYLERYDALSLLDRPISDADAAIDGIRRPVLAPDRDVRPFQDVLLELGARLRLPGMVDAAGQPRYPGGYAQYLVEHERTRGVGLLAGWRGPDGDAAGVGAPNPAQLERYAANGCFWRHPVPERGRYYRMANRDYLEWALAMGFTDRVEAQVLELYCETLQRFRLAAAGHGALQPPADERDRVERYCDPLPFWYEPFESDAEAAARDYPLSAITQRPMFMYHAWGSQNRWLRQIATRNVLYVHPDTARRYGLTDGGWAEVRSHHGVIVVPVAVNRTVEPGTVWTWNAIGKRRGAWALDPDAPEGRRGFLINHLISDLLPRGRERHANADPVTGQGAWYDLRVALRPVAAPRDGASMPQFEPLGGARRR